MSDIDELFKLPIACPQCDITLVKWEKINEKMIKITRGNGNDCPICEAYQPTYYL